VLAADHRLRESDAFRRTVRAGRRAGGRALVVHLLLGDQLDPTDPGASAPRVGFVVSKAVGNAVVRNRVKRRLRHLAQLRVDLLPDGSSLVVRALPAAAALDSAELGPELDRCLQRVGIESSAATGSTVGSTQGSTLSVGP
jgi:ribonuclease P protein component